MPELPEVQTIVATLRPVLPGRRIVRVVLLRSDILDPPAADLSELLSGHLIQSIDRRGKRIIIRLDDGRILRIHLGMTGRLVLSQPSAPLAPHTHLVIEFNCTLQLRFIDPRRFGGVSLLEPGDAPDAGLGPEPLSLSAAGLARRLAGTGRPIKSALLDQALIAGLGNIYVDESLFTARIHPLTPARQLNSEEVGRLSNAIKATLRRAIAAGGSSLRDYVDANGRPGGFQKLHSVYGRENQPCRKCKSAIARLVLSGRSTHYCPKCQREQRCV